MHWKLKIAAKIVLSRLPVPYSVWQRIGLFRHGDTDDPKIALDKFSSICRSYLDSRDPVGTVMEMGPGDGALTGFAAVAHGAEKVWLMDVGDFISVDAGNVSKLAAAASQTGLTAALQLEQGESVGGLMAANNIRYMTNGLAAFKEVPDHSVDLIWSCAVLEHVRLHEVDATFREMRRVLKPGGMMLHQIDFKDHLAASLNNLRFSQKRWESDLFAKSGFYTNRILFTETMARFKAAGFEVTELRRNEWSSRPVQENEIDPAFRSVPDSDFLIQDALFMMR